MKKLLLTSLLMTAPLWASDSESETENALSFADAIKSKAISPFEAFAAGLNIKESFKRSLTLGCSFETLPELLTYMEHYSADTPLNPNWLRFCRLANALTFIQQRLDTFVCRDENGILHPHIQEAFSDIGFDNIKTVEKAGEIVNNPRYKKAAESLLETLRLDPSLFTYGLSESVWRLKKLQSGQEKPSPDDTQQEEERTFLEKMFENGPKEMEKIHNIWVQHAQSFLDPELETWSLDKNVVEAFYKLPTESKLSSMRHFVRRASDFVFRSNLPDQEASAEEKQVHQDGMRLFDILTKKVTLGELQGDELWAPVAKRLQNQERRTWPYFNNFDMLSLVKTILLKVRYTKAAKLEKQHQKLLQQRGAAEGLQQLLASITTSEPETPASEAVIQSSTESEEIEKKKSLAKTAFANLESSQQLWKTARDMQAKLGNSQTSASAVVDPKAEESDSE